MLVALAVECNIILCNFVHLMISSCVSLCLMAFSPSALSFSLMYSAHCLSPSLLSSLPFSRTTVSPNPTPSLLSLFFSVYLCVSVVFPASFPYITALLLSPFLSLSISLIYPYFIFSCSQFPRALSLPDFHLSRCSCSLSVLHFSSLSLSLSICLFSSSLPCFLSLS